eukprot:scaffold63738_cov80-Attheya_sp.AAC.1
MSQDPDFQNLLAGLSVDPRGDQTPSASGAGRGGGVLPERLVLLLLRMKSNVSFQASRADQAPRSVQVSSMSLEQVISLVESMSDPPSSKSYRVVQIALDP